MHTAARNIGGVNPSNSNLSPGPQVVAIPGPSVMPPRVLEAFGRAMPDIYEGELIEASDALWELLPPIVGTSTAEQFIAVSNGHGAWEMTLANLVTPGDKLLVANCGVFAAGWGEMAQAMGCEVHQIDAEPGRAVDPSAIQAYLEADTNHTVQAVLLVHVDTASSAINDLPAVRAAIDAAGHPALLLVDAVASLACDELRMDAWGIDVVVGASQKGLMTPPGLGMVWASPKAMERHAALAARGEVRTWYWNWAVRRDRSAHYLRYAGTPPVSHIFGLREAAAMILEEGVENVWARHAAVAHAVRVAVDTWTAPGGLSLNVELPAERANCVTTIRTGEFDAEVLRKLCQSELGVTLGIGLRGFAGSSFRIGHMGYVNATSILGVLAAIETGLARLDVPTSGSGVAAAAAALA